MIRFGALLLVFMLVGFGLGAGPNGSPLVPEARAEAESDPRDDGFLSFYLALEATASDRERGIAELRRGLALRERDPDGARRAFVAAAELIPFFADWAHVLAADAAARAADTAAVRRLLAASEPVLARDWGWRFHVRALRAAGDPAAAAAVAALTAARTDEPGIAAEAWKSAGDLRLARRDTAGARVAYRNAVQAAQGSQHALAAARILSELPGATPADRLLIGRLYLRHGNLERGVAGIDAFIAAARPPAAERAVLHLDIGRSLFRAGRYADAERRLATALTQSPAPDVGAEAMLLIGRSQFRLNRRDGAKSTFLQAGERFPGQVATAEALFILADLEQDDGRDARARQLFARAIEAAPASVHAANAAARLGGMTMVARRYTEAARILEDAAEGQQEPRRRQQLLFLAGRAHLANRADSIARIRFRDALALDPAAWYGMRAADMLADGGGWFAALRPAPAFTDRSRLESSGALARLDLLRQLELTESATFELDRLRRYFADRDDALYALAEAFHERGETFRAISIGREIQRREGASNDRLLRIIYPFPYREQIEAEARRQGVDPFLVAGLIRQESMFNPQAVSPAGAIGLMQVMPATGRALARDAGIRNFNPNQLRDPAVNIPLGVRYIGQLLRTYGNRTTDMLAAYNAGAGRLARWRAFPEYGDDDLFAERIPFAETRDYVKIVQQNGRLYGALYAE
jgi:soluble lytic murein transglycosylase